MCDCLHFWGPVSLLQSDGRLNACNRAIFLAKCTKTDNEYIVIKIEENRKTDNAYELK